MTKSYRAGTSSRRPRSTTSRPRTSHSVTSALARSSEAVTRSRFGVDVARMTLRSGAWLRSQLADEGFSRLRGTPSQADADA